VIARVVVQRTPEIGIRVALGAQSVDVIWLVLRMGLKLTLLGTIIGLVGSLALGWGLTRLMPDMATHESWLNVAVAAILIPVGLLACWLPARRAAKVDPIEALRTE